MAMLNTLRLLYIFPDVSYIAELLPSKRDHSFAIQSFHQINGQFVNQEGFIPQNINKLFAKLSKDKYQLILPDFLFTNTIVNVQETEDSRIAASIKNNLLPNLDISLKSHQIETTILTTVNTTTKVQLSAIEKSLLAPIKVFAKKHQVQIEHVAPLTWTLKSIISLEPSISLVQLGGAVYSGLHYIGVDQTNMAQLDDLEVMEETIKTLKGGEPNIQTIYLISNSLLEDKLKEVLSTTLPVQQLVTNRDKQSKIPSYVKYAIEVGAKTLMVDDYPVPKFLIEPPTKEEEEAIYANSKSVAAIQAKAETQAEKQVTVDKLTSKSASATIVTNRTSTKKLQLANSEKKEKRATSTTELLKPENQESNFKPNPTVEQTTEPQRRDAKPKKIEVNQIDLSQFAFNQNQAENQEKSLTSVKKEAVSTTKNKKGENKMIKMIFITIAVFFATIAIGAGIGFGLLTLANKSNQTTKQVKITPTVTVKPSETPTPTPEKLIKAASVLVVNATKKTGYAGKIKAKIVHASEAAEPQFGTIAAANAKGKYKMPKEKDGQLLLMKEKNPALKAALEKATGLKLEYADGIKTEDVAGKYDAVIVLVD